MIFLVRLVAWLLNLMPKKVLFLLGDGIGLGWFYLVRIRRQTVIQNIEFAYGKELSSKEVHKIARSNFIHYGRTLLEMFQSMAWSKEKYKTKVNIHGLDHVMPFVDRGQGGVLLTCHLGNWEVEIGSAAASGIPFDLVVKKSKIQWIDELLHWHRSRIGVNIYWESGTAKDILRSIRKGRFVGFILDQFMGPPIGLPIQFFGKEAGTAAALALMTDRKDIPIIPCYSYRDAGGELHTVFEPPLRFENLSDLKDERLYQKSQVFNDVIEQSVRRHPEQWLWLHRRWKPFRGEPRWKLRRLVENTVIGLVASFLVACAATPATEATPTGIELPPDPKVEVPDLTKEENIEVDEVKSLDIKTSDQRKPWEARKKPKKKIPKPAKKEAKKNVPKKKKTPPAPVVQKEEKPKKKFKLIQVDRWPFEIGERQVIELKWVMIPAGKAVLEVRPSKPFQGRPTLRLWGNVLSNRIVDTIYHVDNTIESYVDRNAFMPYKFLLHMVESAQKKETRVAFDHANEKAFYWAKRISKKWGDQLEDRADALIPQARDMFSALYYARLLDYKLGRTERFFVYENGKNWEVGLTPVKNELVVAKIGAYQCWKIKVDVKLNNVLRPTGDIYLWLSDDSKRYMVKFDAKIKIGSLIGTLVDLREKL